MIPSLCVLIFKTTSNAEQSLNRHILFWLIGLALSLGLDRSMAGGAQPQNTEQGTQELRVLCYNIHHGRGMDNQVDLERIAAVIRRAQPDLVALQEVDNKTLRTGRVDQTHELARLTGLHGKFVKQIDYEGGEYGQAILSKPSLSDVKVHWLPGTPAREQRITGVVEVSVAGKPLSFATTHLHHANATFRVQQTDELNRLFVGSSHPVLLAGDLNAEPASEPLTNLARHWRLAQSAPELKTFPADRPTKQIDYVLFSPKDAFETVSAEVIDEPLASDHCPLFVVLRWQTENAP